MEKYDVIIVGGGPAGLRCAEILCASDLNVLLLEKEKTFGDKVCAGGLTRKDLDIVHIPDSIKEHSIVTTGLFSPGRKSISVAPEPIAVTVSRKNFGDWQRSQIRKDHVKVLPGSRVTELKKGSVIVNGKEEFAYRYLVGADGYNSIVRKYLGLPQEKRLIGIQYQIPKAKREEKRFEIHLHSRYFKAGYAWVFPHKSHYRVGCCADPARVSTRKLKENMHFWIAEQGFTLEDAVYESAPISFDYRGIRFGNIFLTGDAGGFASGLTGEGIYQALVSGEAAARLILDPFDKSEALKYVIQYNRKQRVIMNVLWRLGPFRGCMYDIIMLLLKNKRVRMKLERSFS